jgi:hypothetical protein
VAVDPEDPERWFVSASTGPFAAHGRGSAEAVVYRWEGDGPWEALDGGLARPLDAMPYALTFLDGRLVMALSDGTLHTSADRGDSWQAVALDGEPPTRIVALA